MATNCPEKREQSLRSGPVDFLLFPEKQAVATSPLSLTLFVHMHGSRLDKTITCAFRARACGRELTFGRRSLRPVNSRAMLQGAGEARKRDDRSYIMYPQRSLLLQRVEFLPPRARAPSLSLSLSLLSINVVLYYELSDALRKSPCVLSLSSGFRFAFAYIGIYLIFRVFLLSALVRA